MTAQPSRPAPEPNRLALAFATALALHAGALVAVTLWQAHPPVTPPGEQEITVDLAPAMDAVEAVAPAEVSLPAEAPSEAESRPPETDPVEPPPAESPEASQAAPADEPLPADSEAPAILPPAEIPVARPLPDKPAPKPSAPLPKPPERKPAPPKPRAAERKPPSDPRQGQASASREDAGGSAAAADPNALNRYAAALAAALRNRLQYPDQARSQGASGVATVRFTMDRSGRIVGASLVRSAGSPLLDQAALAAARPGSSLPAAPAALPQPQFTFTVPLRFNLR